MNIKEKEVREIIIKNNQINSINPKEVIAFKIAGDGAMGEPGEINIFINGADEITVARCNYVYGDFDIDAFLKFMEDKGEKDFVACLISDKIPKEWKHVYMGMGNNLCMRNAYFQQVQEKYADMIDSDIYGTYYSDMIEIMRTGKISSIQNMRQEAYKNLCCYVKNAYRKITNENIQMYEGKNTVYMKGYDNCDEINIWNYWQGRGVYNPKIMLIGQDWGCPFEMGDGLKVRLEASKKQPIKPEDDRKCHYFDNMQANKMDFKTDENLAELFRSLEMGYDDLLHVRYDDLYFTNICLGYRNSGNSGNYKRSWITDVEKYVYPKLIEILQPKVIICLGMDTYESFLVSMGRKDNRNKKSFNDLIEENNNNPYDLDGIPVFTFAHCGSMGTLNRNGKTNALLDIQKKDWKNIKKYFTRS